MRLTKEEVLDKLLSIKGNHERDEVISALKESGNYYSEELQEDPQFQDVMRILDVWNNEASFRGDVYDTSGLNRIMAAPIFERLADKEVWDFIDVRIMARVADYAKTYREVISFAQKTLLRLEDFSDNKLYGGIQLALHMNMLVRLIRAKFSEIKGAEEFNGLTETFMHHYNSALEICNRDTEKFVIPLSMLAIRYGVFVMDNEKIGEGLDKLDYTENLHLQKLLKDELKEYEHLAKESAGIPTERERYRIYPRISIERERYRIYLE